MVGVIRSHCMVVEGKVLIYQNGQHSLPAVVKMFAGLTFCRWLLRLQNATIIRFTYVICIVTCVYCLVPFLVYIHADIVMYTLS